MRKKKSALLANRNKSGYLFTAPYIIGMIVLFIPTVVYSLIYSFSKVEIQFDNVATTFVGFKTAGVLGSACATLGVVLPAFTIILIISALIKNFIKYKGVQAFLSGVQPCVVALILSTAATMLLSSLLGFEHIGDSFEFNIVGIIVLPIIVLISALWKKWKKKKPSPILLIIISAVLGMILSPIFSM